MANQHDDLEAIRLIYDTLKPFPESERNRILRWAVERLNNKSVSPAPATKSTPPASSAKPAATAPAKKGKRGRPKGSRNKKKASAKPVAVAPKASKPAKKKAVKSSVKKPGKQAKSVIKFTVSPAAVAYVKKKSPQTSNQMLAAIFNYYTNLASKGERVESLGKDELAAVCKACGLKVPNYMNQLMFNSTKGKILMNVSTGRYKIGSQGKALADSMPLAEKKQSKAKKAAPAKKVAKPAAKATGTKPSKKRSVKKASAPKSVAPAVEATDVTVVPPTVETPQASTTEVPGE